MTTLHCALCGAAATLDHAQDTGWWPEVWITLTDGTDALVSACPEHESVTEMDNGEMGCTLPITLESIAANLPFEQYAASRQVAIVINNGVDLSTVKQYYPDASFLQDWSTAVVNAADTGRLPDAVLDSYRQQHGDVACALAFRGRATQDGWPGYATLNEQAQRNLYSALRRPNERLVQ